MPSYELCLRAQKQSLDARDSVRPRYAPRYSKERPPQSGINPASRAFSDVCSHRTYLPGDGWKPMDQWLAEEHKLC